MADEPVIFFQCINLKRETSRRERFEAQRLQLPGPVIVTEAIDGRTVDATKAAALGYDRRARLAAYHRDLTDNEIACAGSHRKALTSFLDSSYEFGVIFEDDVILDPKFEWRVANLVTTTWGWDAVKLESRDSGKPGLTLCRWPGGWLTAPARPGLGATAMLYTRRGAEKVLRMTDAFSTGFDTELNAHWRHDIVIVQTHPPLARQDVGLESSIGERKENRQTKGWRDRLVRLQRSVGKRIFMVKTRLRVRCR
ncbi:MAG: glycosyltransferase family 25 protein [Thioalkalivibrio sp.]|nr:glycosyltransferase family 25 protein [Thioalkalivibrio sp.]